MCVCVYACLFGGWERGFGDYIEPVWKVYLGCAVCWRLSRGKGYVAYLTRTRVGVGMSVGGLNEYGDVSTKYLGDTAMGK